MHWFFTGLLIAASAGILAFTGMLLRRLFTTEPGIPDTPGAPADTTADNVTEVTS